MKIETTLSLLSATLATAYASYTKCEQANGSLFKNDFTLKENLDCREISQSCLSTVTTAADASGKFDTKYNVASAFTGLLLYCDGSNAQKSFAIGNGITDSDIKNYLSVSVKSYIKEYLLNPQDARTYVFSIIFENFGNCPVFGKLKDALYDEMWSEIKSACFNKITKPLEGIDHDDIPNLARLRAEVWENIDPVRSVGLHAVVADKPGAPIVDGLLKKVLVGGTKSFLELVPKLSQLDVTTISAIKDGTKLMTDMKTPFKNLKTAGLKAIDDAVLTYIGTLTAPTNNAEILKTKDIDAAQLKTALTDSAFATKFAKALKGIHPDVTKALDKDSIDLLDAHLAKDNFPFLSPAALKGATLAASKSKLVAALNETLVTPIDFPAFLADFCAQFDDPADLSSKTTGVSVTKTCFLSFRAPLKSLLNIDDLVEEISTSPGQYKIKATSFPAGFDQTDLTRAIIMSINQAIFDTDNLEKLKPFLERAQKSWFSSSTKTLKTNAISFLNLTLGTDETIEKFTEDKSRLRFFKLIGVSHPYKGITAPTLLKLDKGIWDNFNPIHAKDSNGIPYSELKSAILNASDGPTFISKLTVSRFPKEMVSQFEFDVLEKLAAKLTKDQWSEATPVNVANMTQRSSATLKAALEDTTVPFKPLQTAVCAKYANILALNTDFNGITVTVECFLKFTDPFNGAALASDLISSAPSSTFSLTYFPSAFTATDFEKELFELLPPPVLNDNGAHVKALCACAKSSWVINNQIASKPVSTDCLNSMKDPLILPANFTAKDVRDAIMSGKKLKDVDGTQLGYILSNPTNANLCRNYSSLKECQPQVQASMSKECFTQIPNRAVGVDMSTIKDNLFQFLTSADVLNKAEWANVTETRLKKLKTEIASSETDSVYTNHVCSKITQKDFIDTFAKVEAAEVFKICKEKTGIDKEKVDDNRSFITKAAFGLTFAAILCNILN